MYGKSETTPTPNHASLTSHADDGWRPLADVCRDLDVPSRRGARWAQAREDARLADKRPRAAGGSPQWWLSSAGAKALRIAMLGEAAVIEENRRLLARLYQSGVCLLGRLFPR